MFLLTAIVFINIILWIIFLVKFKNLFSTDDIITKTRTDLNLLKADFQRDVALGIDSIREEIRTLKAVSAEAERKVTILQKELNQLEQNKMLKEKSAALGSSISAELSKASDKHKKTHKKSPAAELAYQVNDDVQINRNALSDNQGELFEQKAAEVTSSPISVMQDGTSYGRIPLVAPKVVINDTPIESKVDFTRKVMQLYQLGKTVEEIASELSRSTTEVQFVVDMN